MGDGRAGAYAGVFACLHVLSLHAAQLRCVHCQVCRKRNMSLVKLTDRSQSTALHTEVVRVTGGTGNGGYPGYWCAHHCMKKSVGHVALRWCVVLVRCLCWSWCTVLSRRSSSSSTLFAGEQKHCCTRARSH